MQIVLLVLAAGLCRSFAIYFVKAETLIKLSIPALHIINADDRAHHHDDHRRRVDHHVVHN
ncbi:hypothetical protein [Chitinophaga sp. LS1]|uniref:hypothetical protein n=1 Tax=Chitinophaga sp. LS1 TaxID=3051176 RepID=UPI002AAB2F9E|nr:hypothetical protein [Chitinophaga sp. LS1]WPV64646.1 hypothetical protein QQL36_22855 [Chitinophaga sp. LS1]